MLIATITLLLLMPARCWIAPLMPTPRRAGRHGLARLPHLLLVRAPASTLARRRRRRASTSSRTGGQRSEVLHPRPRNDHVASVSSSSLAVRPDVLQSHAGRGTGDLEPLDGRRARGSFGVTALGRSGRPSSPPSRRPSRSPSRDAKPSRRSRRPRSRQRSRRRRTPQKAHRDGQFLPRHPRGEEDRARDVFPRPTPRRRRASARGGRTPAVDREHMLDAVL